MHRTNLAGLFLGCKYAIRAMRRHRAGSIINISSRSGLVGILNVRCNSIHPAAILTPMWEPMLGTGLRAPPHRRAFDLCDRDAG